MQNLTYTTVGYDKGLKQIQIFKIILSISQGVFIPTKHRDQLLTICREVGGREEEPRRRDAEEDRPPEPAPDYEGSGYVVYHLAT